MVDMVAGRELDALVAERVMGWTYWRSKHGHWIVEAPDGARCEPLFGRVEKYDSETGKKLPDPLWYDGVDLPDYSTDIAVAWLVVEKLNDSPERPMWFRCRTFNDGRVWVGFCNHLLGVFDCEAETLPLAICLAALKAKSTEV